MVTDVVDLNGLRSAIEGVGNQISTAINIKKEQDRATAAELSLSNRINSIPIRNLIENWNFIYPINQRRKTQYVANGNVGYTIDRWYTQPMIPSNVMTVTPGYGLKIEATKINQYTVVLSQKVRTTWINYYHGKMTLSIAYINNTHANSLFITVSNNYSFGGNRSAYGKPGAGILTVTFDKSYITADPFDVGIGLEVDGSSVTVLAAKLEFGDHQTLAYQYPSGELDILDPFDQSLELLKCQKYQFVIGSSSHWYRVDALTTGANLYFEVVGSPLLLNGNATMVNVSTDSTLQVETLGYAVQTGFTFGQALVHDGSIRILASKASHGLTDAHIHIVDILFDRNL